MSYQSKRILASMAAGAAAVIAYVCYATGRTAPEADAVATWATVMLIFIGAGVGLVVVAQILFHILLAVGTAVKRGGRDATAVERELKILTTEDERERLIQLRSARVGYCCVGLGCAALLVMLTCGAPVVAAMHVLCGALAGGSLLEGAVSVYFYEAGVRHG